MDLVRLALATAGAWAFLALMVVPLLRRRADVADLAQRPRRLAVCAFFETGASIAFWLTLSFLGALAITAYLTVLSPSTISEADQALGRVDAVFDLVARVSRHWGLLASVVALFALLIWSYRRVRRVETANISREVNAELKRVTEERQRGELPVRAAGPMLQSVQIAHAQKTAQLAAIEAASAAGTADPQSKEKAAAARAEVERLRALVTEADTMERAYERVAGRVKSQTRRFRVATFFGSQGMLTTMSAGLKAFSVLILLLSVPASLAVTGQELGVRLLRKADALKENIREFRLVAQLSEAEAEFRAEVEADASAEVAELSEIDEAAADGLARIFESEVVPQSWNLSAPPVTTEAAVRMEAQAVRNAILQKHAERAPALLRTNIATPAAAERTFLTEADSLLRQSAQSRGPVTEVGRLAAAENRRLAREHPQLWSKLRSGYQSYAQSFGRLAPPQQIRSLAVSQVVGDIFSAAGGDSLFARHASTIGGEMTSDAAKAYVEASHKRFVVEIARGGDVTAAAQRAAQIGEFAATPQHASALRQIASLTPDNARLAEIASSTRPALYAADAGASPDRVGRAVDRIARTTSTRPVQLADSLVSFEDYFPGSRGDEQRTRRAAISRDLSLQGAPPAPGSETQSYTRRSQTMASRAGSYRSLRGFARVGGVLIGREPEDGSVATQSFEWRLDGSGFSFAIQAEGGTLQHFGPFNPAIANLALAYAADGRPTTVTMVSADPLPELKILTHPALIDTGLGCRARRLDQFVDEITSENDSLQAVRSVETSAAVGEIALYRVARGLRIEAFASDPGVLQSLEGAGAEGLIEAGERDAHDTNLLDASLTALGQNGPLQIASKPQYFDAALVEHIAACRANSDSQAFADCISPRFAVEIGSATDDKLLWLAPAPTYQVWSGVREQPYSVAPDFEFLRSGTSDSLAPFAFMVQVAIDSPAYFLPSDAPWFVEDNVEIDEYVDPEVWEFPNTGVELVPALTSAIAENAERSSVLGDMSEFALLQRFFRAALDGRLGTGFPLPELVGIEEATATAVNRAAQTLRWNVRPGEVEASFLADLDSAGGDPAAEACRAFILETDQAGGSLALSAIEQSTWEEKCGAAALGATSVANRAEQIAGIRELRDSLGVRSDEALAFTGLECPIP